MNILQKILVSTGLAVYSASSIAGMLVLSGDTFTNLAVVNLTLPDGGSVRLDELSKVAVLAQASDTVVYDTLRGDVTVLANVKPSMVINDELNLENVDLYLDVFVYDETSGSFSRSTTGEPFPTSTLQNSISYVDVKTFTLRNAIAYFDDTVAIAIDTDGDGISDTNDNCILVSNSGQQDSNGDGFGNICDADLDNNGNVTLSDYIIFRGKFGTTDADADFNSDGLVNLSDFILFRGMFGTSPGPSGLVP